MKKMYKLHKAGKIFSKSGEEKNLERLEITAKSLIHNLESYSIIN